MVMMIVMVITVVMKVMVVMLVMIVVVVVASRLRRRSTPAARLWVLPEGGSSEGQPVAHFAQLRSSKIMQHATLITPSRYAKLRGLSRSTISREVKRGQIPTHKGLIDPREADLARKRNLDMSRRPQDAAAADDLAAISSSASAYEILIRARAARELAAAKERQLNLRKRQGELLELEDVKRTWTNAVVAMENRLRQIPDVLAPRVAAMDNVLDARALIAKEIESALRALYEAETDAR